ncbi:ermin [Ornithorhynchus anatinus]|uniref:Ermin n=1 Tax=Ornithorhynchus anatinus TaxID=9258 RepID=A0A6I8PIU9_ORNAN|nr:ermin [Ornithorhynchus anatinus]XP_028928439.1 ermin [Ornithorhynchus anatinus]
MTEVPGSTTVTECNGDMFSEKAQLAGTEISEGMTKSFDTVRSDSADTTDAPLSKRNQEECKNPQGKLLCRDLSLSLDGEQQLEGETEEIVSTVQEGTANISLQEARADEVTSGAGLQVAKNPFSSNDQEITCEEERSMVKLQGGRVRGGRKTEISQAEEVEEDLERQTSQKRSQAGSEPQLTGEVEDEEREKDHDDDDVSGDDGDEDVDEVRLIELKKENGEDSCFKMEENGSDSSPPSSPSLSSQPATPEEQPGSGKKSDISRHSYSRYNTISYRKIRKGNTKQRIDEFESMMHL